MKTKLSGANSEIIISEGKPTTIIGERINPTGKAKLTAALRTGDLRLVCQEASEQVAAGADILDINVGCSEVDEVELLPKVVQAVSRTVDVPLCLDSKNLKALEAALGFYRGKPLINSVNGEDSSLSSVLPLVKKYGAAVVGLTMDNRGIPDTSEERFRIARKIVQNAEAVGIPREDVIIDCLALAVGADTRAGRVVIDSIRRVKQELDVNQTIGASNISFGLPDRSLLTGYFLAIAIAAGVTCPVVDTAKVYPAILAADLLLGQDDFAMRYIRGFRKRQKS